jgi:ATP-dependent DNA helicase RecG
MARELERQNLEWKSSWRDEYLKWICGYANAKGGVLSIGKDDSGKVIGLVNPQKLLKDIPNKIKNSMGILVDVDLEYEDDKPFISISVLPHYSPISYHGKYYYRTGSTMHELTGRTLDEFMMKKMGRTWDSISVPNVTVDDLDPEAFKVFRQKAIESGRLKERDLRITDGELLANLGLLDEGKLRMAAVLLFHAQPSRFVTGAFIKIGYFENDGDLIYQDEIQSSLVTITDKVEDILYLKYFKGIIHYEGLQRVDQYPVDRNSMREAILNAITHNNYIAYDPILIKVYPDRVYIFNSGGLPTDWTTETLFKTHRSIQRNPNIAMTIFRTGMIEAWGSGIEKIVAGCRHIDAPDPVFDSLGDTTSIMLIAPDDAVYRPEDDKLAINSDKRASVTEKVPVNAGMTDIFIGLTEKVPKTERKQAVLDFIDAHNGIANSDAQRLLGVSEATVKRLFKEMVAAGRLEAIGDKKGRIYYKPPTKNTSQPDASTD